jgi:hypothetical protein
MKTNEPLKSLFEEQVVFHLRDGTLVDDNVFIGDAELLPVEILRSDEDAYQAEFNRWLYDVWFPEQEDLRNQILKLHGNHKRYSDLTKAVKRQQAIPLIGSGMSVASGLPTWSNLLRGMLRYVSVDAAKFEKLLKVSAFEEAADLIASATNPNLLNERVEHDLRIDEASKINGPVRLLPAIFPGVVITTNLDNVLELQYDACHCRFEQILAGRDLARYRKIKAEAQRFLLKLHGDCQKAATRVLLSKEYEDTYAPGSDIAEELVLLYRTCNILFLGCSLGADRTVRLFAEVAKGDHGMPKHYAFLAIPDADETRKDRENFLSERGIYPIWYKGSDDESITALLAGLIDLEK